MKDAAACYTVGMDLPMIHYWQGKSQSSQHWQSAVTAPHDCYFNEIIQGATC